ncbi:phage portal protein [Paenibacillus odorifer]|uniref:Phage portal protein n=1 Tax=Paenibacillus odorifer TaxID=189426 RepID=A0A1R0WUZ4_9BACL|nr:phage portal protein [Paenibacillus odorifer]OMD21701.1 hypothetical protein BJP51_32015 [Paenibacillus odorifer]
MFQVGQVYPPADHEDRIERYRENAELISCSKYMIRQIAQLLETEEHRFIYTNYAGLICKKSADLLFGESPIYSAGEDSSTEQKALERIVKDNALGTVNYEMAYGNAYRGDSFYKVKWAQEYRGALSETLDPYRAVIEAQNAAYVFPETIPGNEKKIAAYHIAVPVKVTEGNSVKWELFVETHRPGELTTAKYAMTAQSTKDGEVISWNITEEIEAPSAPIETGVPLPLVVHVPNFALDTSWHGVDDITENRALLREINHRLTQISNILDKHADPILAVPTGVLEDGPDGVPQQKAAYAKVFEIVGKDDVIPQYVTWDGQLESAFKELDKLIDALLTVSELPPVALGKENAGTSGATGLAVKYRMGPLLSKTTRKRQYFDKALVEVLFIAQLLEHAQSREELGYTPTKPHIIFKDGLPTDAREMAEIAQIRTGGKATMAVSDAIKLLDGGNDEQAAQAIARIDGDESRTGGTVDSSLFNDLDESAA